MNCYGLLTQTKIQKSSASEFPIGGTAHEQNVILSDWKERRISCETFCYAQGDKKHDLV
jgi:hypothetical protein